MRYSKNNVYPLKPEFRQYTNKNIAKDKPEFTGISALISVAVICFWCLSMVLLAKASYQFLQEIGLKSVQKIELNQK
ncbi:MAG: hypothetical protein AAF349_13060 [Cyanobacteria bacterium P01_A01_bin.68]